MTNETLKSKSEPVVRPRSLGVTGMEISEIGFGCWGFGGDSYGQIDQFQVHSLVQLAVARGVNFFDTADLYGDGQSEKFLGGALAEINEPVFIASKVGYLENGARQDFSRAHILSSIRGTLQRLRRPRVDLYQLHDPPIVRLVEENEILDTMAEIKGEGLIRAIGVSVKSPQDGVLALEKIFDRQPFDVLQVNFNLIDQRVLECGLFEKAKERGVGILIKTPLCFGFLTGKYSSAEFDLENDHRSRWKREQVSRWSEAIQDFTTNSKSGVDETEAQFALRYCLSFEAVSSVLTGMMTTEQILENTASSQFPQFEAASIRRFQEIYRENSYFG